MEKQSAVWPPASITRARSISAAFAVTALPALIGARTLSLLREGGAAVFERRLKVSRAEVRRMMLSTTVDSPSLLRAKFEKLQGAAV